jgi:hypothetical protein
MEFSHVLEDYLNNQVAIQLIYSKNQVRPNLQPGDIVFDFSANRGYATLFQWDGKKLVPLSLEASALVGTVNLLTQASGSGTDPTLYLKSDGADHWVLSAIPTAFDPTGSQVLAAVNLTAFTAVTVDGHPADSANSAHYNRVMGIVNAAVLSGNIGTVIMEGEITNPSWAWSPNSKLFLNGTVLSVSVPTSGFAQMIAVAKTTQTVITRLETPVIL